jgi:hypothetical protein
MRICQVVVVFLLLAGSIAASRSARAAESYDNCTGFIDSVPATISTQGTWCLRHDLATNLTSGNAIEIATNNVTLDCNDFKLGGLAAGATSLVTGIHANYRQNVTVRHCNVRGFLTGIELIRGAGYLVEDNLLEGNLYRGIYIFGDNSLVQHNRVFDTGGSTTYSGYAGGISATAGIIDNIVDGLFTEGTTRQLIGIDGYGVSTRIAGNRVGGLESNGGGIVTGVQVHDYNGGSMIAGNRIVAATTAANGYGILGSYDIPSGSYCSGNTVANFATPFFGCQLGMNNDSL